jgi:hypothetical protein
MNTTALEYWRTRPLLLWELQNPGCHTGASGFGYVALDGPADEQIDEHWKAERQAARLRLVRLLRARINS